MKKQILTLTICMTLATSSAFASGHAKSQNITPQPPTNDPPKSAPCAKNCPCQDESTAKTKLTKEQFKQKFEERMSKRREALYAKLGLSQDQKAKAVELDKKNRAEARPLMEKLHEEKTKLNDMQTQKCCPVKLIEQKQKVKEARKALRKHFITSEKNFEAILTKEQLTKFKAIKEERKAKFKKNCKCKGHCGCKKHPLMFEPTVK